MTKPISETAPISDLPVIGNLTDDEIEVFEEVKDELAKLDKQAEKELAFFNKRAEQIKKTYHEAVQRAADKMKKSLTQLNNDAAPAIMADQERRKPTMAKAQALWDGLMDRMELDKSKHYAIEWENGPVRVVELPEEVRK